MDLLRAVKVKFAMSPAGQTRHIHDPLRNVRYASDRDQIAASRQPTRWAISDICTAKKILEPLRRLGLTPLPDAHCAARPARGEK